ncbi:flagellar hook-associated protein FlgK [Glaciihabitans sp. dw_435]|uniref:flagellar hook-associated protein FlgK n=1 Tax=Glaciihabitans sp. dw_435 TaxID=2720081 RepID=UPI001BD345F2|nr:flagellar hook-associated protein FlgK [Glaciihabitans sp. dw_435]
MSTFSGLNSAYTALVAARTAIDVTGQNIANAKTEGYTRQRVSLSPVAPLSSTGILANPLQSPGQGVSVTGIARLANQYLDAQVRSTASSAGFSYVRADALSSLEKSLNEPGANGISTGLQNFWASWQDLSNKANSGANASVVLEEGANLSTQIAAGYTAAASQWQSVRSNADVTVTELNSAAEQVAKLNQVIRQTQQSGGSVNELLDQRDLLTTRIATLAGGTVNSLGDGTVEVLIGGNPIVSGTTFNPVTVAGSRTMDTGTVQLEWAARPGVAVALDGGELAGTLSLLAPSNTDGTGGAIAEAAQSYNDLAIAVAAQVNAVHETGVSSTGATGLDFFSVSATGPAALGLKVIPTTGAGIATGAVGGGALDGSIADKISKLSAGPGSPDALWGGFVTKIAVATKSELQQSVLADLAANGAVTAQLSNASVDLDEENVNLLMSQTAYQGAARVLTAMDEMLDTLINKTGLVGR